MKYNCPDLNCPGAQNKKLIGRDGYYFRKNDSRYVRRFKCKVCGKKFSQSTSTLEYRQKKRRINNKLRILLCSSVSMRRAAKILNVNKITIARKVIYLAKKAQLSQKEFLESLKENPVDHVQIDDLITSEQTKLKPLSISIGIDVNTSKILGAEVSSIPAFGRLAIKSREKYGKRESTHYKKMIELFINIKDSISTRAIFESDQHKVYPHVIKKFFKNANHLQYKGGRGAVVGQGELKKLEYDPLFAINHTCAMLRANISRLVRKTWCTTKKAEMLQRHLDIYVNYHNSVLKV